jgi:hypothetical protein
MASGLPVSRLISVSVNLSALPTQAQNFNSCLILGTSAVIDVVTRIRSYASLAAVATDFGTSAPEYLAAVLWFEQNPQPTSLLIGRWAKTASAGQLIGGAVSAANQAASAWTSITNGSFKIQIDSGSLTTVTGLNFSAVTNMNGVASVINTALEGLSPSASCVWNATYQNFVITSNTTGTSSQISFAQTAGSGTDISAQAALTAATGAYQAGGIAAETALAAVTLFDTNFSSQWYGLVVPGAAQADHLAIASYIEASSNLHYYGVTDQEAAVLVPGDTSTTAYLLQQLGLNHTCVQYSSSNAYAVVSYLARMLTTNWSDNNSAITMMYKTEPGIVAENLNATQIAALEAKNCNVFVNYNNGTAIIEMGVSSSGQFTDTIVGVDSLRANIQTNVYNLLYTSPTKIPQTDAGMQQIATAIEAACDQSARDGLLAAGTWGGSGFGQISTGSYLSKGYYIYTPPLSSQAAGPRSARVSVPFQVAAHLAGAVHTASVAVNVA